MKKFNIRIIGALLLCVLCIGTLSACGGSDVDSESEARRVLLSCVSTLKEVEDTLNEMDKENLDAKALKNVEKRLNGVYADIKSTDIFYEYEPVKERYDSAEKKYESVLKKYEGYMKILEEAED